MEYVYNGENLGIAAALNVGAKRAAVKGFQYLLTVDQDSEVPPDTAKNLLECFFLDSNVAIVSPEHYPQKTKNDLKPCEEVYTVWTSGNLVDLNKLNKAGGYREDLFIDYVDHEICLRLNSLGYKIYKCHKSVLKHNLGKIEEKKFFNRKVYTTNHSPIRLYYRSRNRFYVHKIYKNLFPEFIKKDSKDFWKSFLKVVLFEKYKLKKIRYFILGYIDFKRNRFGKLTIN